jgi:hypothetical protein
VLKVEGGYQGIDMGGGTGELLGHPCKNPQRRLIK